MDASLFFCQSFKVYTVNFIFLLIIFPFIVEAKQPKLGQLNTTQKAIILPIMLRDDMGIELGEIKTHISIEDKISLFKLALIKTLKPQLKESVIASLQKTAAIKGYLSLETLQDSGFDIRFLADKMELLFAPKGGQRPDSNLSFSGKKKIISKDLNSPQVFSGYVNILAAINHVITNNKSELQSPSLDLEFAVRLYDVVLETEANVNSIGSSGIDFKQYFFSRQGSRLIYDYPEGSLRFQLGDLRAISNSVRSLPKALGLSVEKSDQKLQPRKNIRSTGRSSFQLDRASTVEVRNNGRIIRTLHLRSGHYNLSDLQLSQGANDITLKITNDLGQIKELNFSIFSNNELLAKGISEWGLEVGFRSNFENNKLLYDFKKPMASGFYRQGLTDNMSGDVYFQVDKTAVLSGFGLWSQSQFGFLNLSAELSQHEKVGVGYSANLSWSRDGEIGVNNWRSSFRLSADYTSAYFTLIDQTTIPQINKDWIRLNMGYSQGFGMGIAATLSANYTFENKKNSQYKGDTYGVDLNVNKQVSPDLGLGATIGYSNTNSSNSSDSNRKGEWYASVNLNYRLGENANIRSEYHTRTEQGKLSFQDRSKHNGVGSWNTNVDVDYFNKDKRTTLTGNVRYLANRANINLSHTSSLDNAKTGQISTKLNHNTRLQIGTSLAFSGRKFAWGQPIRSGGFAIISLHESLKDSTLMVGTPDNVIAESSIFGPALVSGLSEYTAQQLTVDVDDMPLGYDLGSGSFDVLSPYKAGYHLMVGSNYSVSAYGTLLNKKDEPLVYITGVAYEGKDKKGQQSNVFTNKSGRFGAEGLAPGIWLIEMNTDPAVQYIINIPKDTKGMYKTGKLKPI